jgi:hypothetical protein
MCSNPGSGKLSQLFVSHESDLAPSMGSAQILSGSGPSHARPVQAQPSFLTNEAADQIRPIVLSGYSSFFSFCRKCVYLA